MGIKFEPGELFVYTNGNRWELGMVKRPGNGDGYFCWYSRGDTAAFTPTSCMHKLSNAGFTHIEQLLDDATVGAGTCHIEPDGWYKCPDCGCVVGYSRLYGGDISIMLDDYQIPLKHCPNCGKRIIKED